MPVRHEGAGIIASLEKHRLAAAGLAKLDAAALSVNLVTIIILHDTFLTVDALLCALKLIVSTTNCVALKKRF